MERQLEFEYVKKIDEESEESKTRDLMNEVAEEARSEFKRLMGKYKVSMEDAKRIFLVANQMKLTE